MNLVNNLAGKFKVATLMTGLSILSAGNLQAADEIKVGVLFSQTGGLSIVEKSLASATMMAIDEINEAGGVKGMMIKPVLEDGASDPKTFNEKASKLVIRDRVATVFGGYTSASRKRYCRLSRNGKTCCSIPHFMKVLNAQKMWFTPVQCRTSN